MSRSVHEAPFSFSSPAASVLRAAGVLALAVMLGAALAPQTTQAQTIEVVTNTNDSGTGSLRAAINTLNDGSGTPADTIKFNISGSGPHEIVLSSVLPVITDPLVIDGTTEPDYPNRTTNTIDAPVVEVDGVSTSGGSDIFSVGASDSQLIGLSIVNSQDEAIEIANPNARIDSCFVGIAPGGANGENSQNPSGLEAAVLIDLDADNSVVKANVISGNEATGLQIRATNTQVEDNIVGLEPDGETVEGNGSSGVVVEGNDNLIGNAFFAFDFQGNLIFIDNGNTVSANAGNGIEITGDDNVVKANEVGTSVNGTTSTDPLGVSLGNGNNGIVVKGTGSDPSQGNLIGDIGLGRNLVSGNDKDGIALGNNSNGEVSSQDTVRANVVGLNASQDAALPNGANTSLDGGIVVSRADDAVIDSNTVSGNDGQGIIVFAGGGDNDADISDNIVGTNSNFASGLGNAYDGIQVKPNPSSNSGETQVVENIVGNNENDGIDIRGSYHDVVDNYIGAAPDGSDIGNGVNNQGRGIKLGNGPGSLESVFIGGILNGLDSETDAAGFSTPTGTGNVIGYNRADGILVRGQATTIGIRENYVGTNPNGADLGNGTGSNLGSAGDGIRIVENNNIVDDIRVGYRLSLSISSPDPADGGDGNVVAYNSADGISAGSDESTTDVSGVTVRGNSVFQNGAADMTNVGIDLGNSGQTANDAGDGDSGPNNLQNFPNIQSVSYNSSNSTVTIDYDVPTNSGNADFSGDGLKVDFYAADSEQSGEGKIYLGSQNYTTANATNVVSFDLSTFSNVDSDDYFVATATDANGNTSEFCGPPGKPLPVELANFEGTQSDKSTVELRWTTASEKSNAGFRVQRRKAAGETGSAGAWQKVGFVESKATGGTTTETTTYRFTAEDLGVGAHEFRLKQIDLDGTTHLHDPVTVELRMQQALRLGGPAPNPVQNRATVSFAVRDQAEATITLYNTLGQVVRTLYRGTPSAGERQTESLDASGLSSGVYFLRLQAGGQTKARKVTVVR